jgi:hypothetical protein
MDILAKILTREDRLGDIRQNGRIILESISEKCLEIMD